MFCRIQRGRRSGAQERSKHLLLSFVSSRPPRRIYSTDDPHLFGSSAILPPRTKRWAEAKVPSKVSHTARTNLQPSRRPRNLTSTTPSHYPTIAFTRVALLTSRVVGASAKRRLSSGAECASTHVTCGCSSQTLQSASSSSKAPDPCSHSRCILRSRGRLMHLSTPSGCSN